MSNNQIVIDTLLIKREQLMDEKRKMTERFDSEISEIENAIETLAGKRVWDNSPTVRYDDEHPEYIKQSQEEI